MSSLPEMVPPQPLNVAIDLKIPGLPVPHMTQKVLHLIEVIWDTATTQPWEVSIDIELPGILMAQPRARFRVFQTKQGNQCVGTYHPKSINDWKAMAQAHVRAQYTEAPLDQPLLVCIDFRFPKTLSESRIKSRMNMLMPHHVKPDIDNIWKAIQDALTGVLWRDDACIAMSFARKVCIPVTERPCIRLQVIKLLG